MSAITSSANGTYTDCGLGQGVGLTITCGGSSCGILSQFPHLQCSNDPISSSTSCNNGVTCPGTPNFKSIFQMQQHPDNTVSTQQQLEIDGQNFKGTDDGHGVVAYSGPTNVPNTSGPSQTEPGAGGSGQGTATGTGSGTRNPTISAAASTASSSRRPPLSKALFVVWVILSVFVGQSTADNSFIRFKELTVTTAVSLIWALVIVPVRTHAQACTTVGVFPVLPFSSLSNI